MSDITEFQPTTAALQGGLVGQLVKAEIDQQISTAHAYPRSITRVMNNVLGLVTISPAAAEECNYALPRGKQPVTGPSIRLAEIVASQWGNCRIGARVVHVDRFEKYVEAEGVFHDLETNTATTARVRRRIVDSRGNLYSDDMIIVTGNAACSIAKRNAILAGVPKAVWFEAYETALKTVKGDVKTLPERRVAAFKAFAAFGVKPEQIFTVLNVGGEDDIGLDHLATLIAMHKAIKDGEETVEGFFPPQADPAKTKEAAKGTTAKMADIAKTAKPKDDEVPDQDGVLPDKKAAPADKKASLPDKVQELPDKGAPQDADGPAITAARERGMQARAKGIPKKALPGDLREEGREDEATAWLEGWDAGAGE